MDPLSLTASSIAIIQLTTDLITGTQKFYKSVKNAPEEISAFIEELTVFGTVLERLLSLARKAETTRLSQAAQNGVVENSREASRLPMLQKMVHADGPLITCYEEMLVFKGRLTLTQSKMKMSLKWPFKKDEIMAIVRRLRILRSIMDSAIASDQL